VRNLAIETNDASLVVVDEDAIVCSEPGFVVVKDSDILTGDAAYAEARLKPSITSYSHWSKLSIEPGSASVPGRRPTAELAYEQLNRLWLPVGKDVDHAVLVVPGSFGSEAV